MKIVGFAGKAGSGKTTLARALVDQHGFERVSFAGLLKAALAAMGIPEPATQALKEEIIPELGVSWRHCAQTLGTEWGRRRVNPDIWVKLTIANLKEDGRYVFDDVRFENESMAIRSAGGVIVHLHGRAATLAEGTQGHASEAGIAAGPGDLFFQNGHDIGTADGDMYFSALLTALGLRGNE